MPPSPIALDVGVGQHEKNESAWFKVLDPEYGHRTLRPLSLQVIGYCSGGLLAVLKPRN